MSFLHELHGAVALFLLCGLLFIEEAGVPLLFAPGDLVLISAGLLIAAGALNAWIFVPAAIVACVAGALIGYTWSRRLSEGALRSVAARLHATQQVDRVLGRIRHAGASGVFVARLLPGLRVYTTLAAGAAGVPLRAFLAGVTSATVVWVIGFTTLGTVVGFPAVQLLDHYERLAFEGLVLLGVGLIGLLMIRLAPRAARTALAPVGGRLRIPVGLVLEVVIPSAIAAGLVAVGRQLIHSTSNLWIDPASMIALVIIVGLAALAWRNRPISGRT